MPPDGHDGGQLVQSDSEENPVNVISSPHRTVDINLVLE